MGTLHLGTVSLIVLAWTVSACSNKDNDPLTLKDANDHAAGGSADNGDGDGDGSGGTDVGDGDGGLGGASGDGDGDGDGDRDGVERKPLGDVVFQEGQVLTIDIILDEALQVELEEKGNEEVYLPAAATINGAGVDESFAELGFRHKGAYSLHHCWDDNNGVRSYEAECAKLSYKLKFSEIITEGRLDGLKRLNLHAASGDISKLRDLIAYKTFRDFGIDAPRTAPARLTINGELMGLFIAVEAIDGRYTTSHYPAGPDGNLYKERWPQGGVDEEAFLEALKTNEEEKDVSAMLAFAAAVAASSNASFAEDMAPFLDIDHTLRYIAVDRALKNWDGIMAFYSPETSHNFYWYHDDGPEGLFHLIPWDLDNTFWAFDPYMAPQDWATAAPLPDWNTKPDGCDAREVWEPGSGVWLTPPRCDALLDRLAEAHFDDFAVLGTDLLAGPFSLAVLNEQVSTWKLVLEPLVEEDPLLDADEWRAAVDEFSLNLDTMHSDFALFVAQGLLEENVALVPADLDETTANSGLHIGSLTNFEFSVPITGEPDGVFSVNDDSASLSVYWNEDDPLSGAADLRADFEFVSNPDSYDEWVNIGLSNSPISVAAYSAIVMTLRADKDRTVRIRMLSNAYDSEWGGIWSEFGQYFEVGTEPTKIVFRFNSLSYPEWAKDSWEADQGFVTTDAAARSLALTTFTGLIFGPEPSWDDEGALPTETETGFLEIDNLYFQ